MKLFRSLFISNPFILASHGGARRVGRAMSGSKSGTLLAALGCIPLTIVVALTLAFGSSGGSNAAGSCFFIAVIAQYLIIPPIFFNAVAGERERGSWELLRVAPVTTVQVLVGKFYAGFIILLPWFVTLILAVLTVQAVSLTENNPGSYYQSLGAWEFFGSFAVIFGQALLLSSLTIFLSSRMKKPFTALLASYGIAAFAAIMMPFVLGILAEPGNFTGKLWESVQPASQIIYLVRWRSDYENVILPWPMFTLIYFIISVILLTWSALTLDFPDRDLKFVKKKGK